MAIFWLLVCASFVALGKSDQDDICFSLQNKDLTFAVNARNEVYTCEDDSPPVPAVNGKATLVPAAGGGTPYDGNACQFEGKEVFRHKDAAWEKCDATSTFKALACTYTDYSENCALLADLKKNVPAVTGAADCAAAKAAISGLPDANRKQQIAKKRAEAQYKECDFSTLNPPAPVVPVVVPVAPAAGPAKCGIERYVNFVESNPKECVTKDNNKCYEIQELWDKLENEDIGTRDDNKEALYKAKLKVYKKTEPAAATKWGDLIKGIAEKYSEDYKEEYEVSLTRTGGAAAIKFGPNTFCNVVLRHLPISDAELVAKVGASKDCTKPAAGACATVVDASFSKKAGAPASDLYHLYYPTVGNDATACRIPDNMVKDKTKQCLSFGYAGKILDWNNWHTNFPREKQEYFKLFTILYAKNKKKFDFNKYRREMGGMNNVFPRLYKGLQTGNETQVVSFDVNLVPMTYGASALCTIVMELLPINKDVLNENAMACA